MRTIKKCILSMIVLSIIFSQVYANKSFSVTAENKKTDVVGKTEVTQNSYSNYIEQFKANNYPNSLLKISLMDYSSSNGHIQVVNITKADGKEGEALKSSEEGWVMWNIDVIDEGMYNINLTYLNEKGKGAPIIRSLYIDEKLPFDEAQSLNFNRVFEDDGKIIKDSAGNQVRPFQKEVKEWQSKDFADSAGNYEEPLYFYFSKGKHSIKLEAISEPIIIGEIKLYQRPIPQKYLKDISFEMNGNDYWEVEAENSKYKSNKGIYPLSDNSSSSTQPSSPYVQVLNTIGGNKWASNGEWIDWEINVPKTGYYKIGLRARQNLAPGRPVFRKMYIDGKVMYEQMNEIRFDHSSSWQIIQVGGSEPIYFYLEKGKHTLRLEVNVAILAEIIRDINALVSELREIYMDFFVITGANPDVNRNYDFDKIMPETITSLSSYSDRLLETQKKLFVLNGGAGPQTSQFLNMAQQLKDMGEDANKIPSMIGDFASNISGLGAIIDSLRKHPLEVDYIAFASPNVSFKKANESFIKQSIFVLQQFLTSFTTDYSKIGLLNNQSSKSITVWTSAGKDQANVINQLIKERYNKSNDVQINLKLVAPGTLLNAVMANKAPDISLSHPQTDVINYAMRGALEELTAYDSFDEVSKWFQESATMPLQFEGKTYGLPETQSFPMLFYRKDILSKLGLDVPKTWDEVIRMIPILQKRKLEFGMLHPYKSTLIGVGFSAYAMFLFQNNDEIYSSDSKKSLINSNESILAFKQWLRFYNDFGLPQEYDFVTRFRTGEMPIGISDYSTYNVLSVFAPELSNSWDFALVPGTLQVDGTINRSVASSVTASIMMKDANYKETCWDFLKWWVSSETQQLFGNEIESNMGSAARYQTANIEALYNIPWKTKDIKIIKEQWKYTKGIREVPGSYVAPRYIDFAFKQANTSTRSKNGLSDIKDILNKTNSLIQSEINNKRREFKLPTAN